MIVVPDFRLIVMIVKGRKTTHRFPSGYAQNGNMADPKMRRGTLHKVYQFAPHGSHGKKNENPMAMIEIADIWDDLPWAWEDEHMPAEGFADVYSYGEWWDAWHEKRYKKSWREMENEPFWVCSFRCIHRTVHFDGRFRGWLREQQTGRT